MKLAFVVILSVSAAGRVCGSASIGGDERVAFIVAMSFAVVAVVATYLYLSAKIRAHHEQERGMIAAVESLSEELRLAKGQNLHIRRAVGELMVERFGIVDELCAAYYEHQGTPREQKKICEEVKRHIKSMSDDAATLERHVNRYAGNVMAKFREEFPTLKDSDYKLFLYLVAGFSGKAISVFIGEKLEVVYNRKSRLKSKIRNSDSVSKDIFLELVG